MLKLTQFPINML